MRIVGRYCSHNCCRGLVINPTLRLVIFFAVMTIAVVAQPHAVPHSPPAMETASPSPETEYRNIREGLKSMAENSRNLNSWGLTLIGASILAIVSTSYMRPMSRKTRLAYLLFIPGWYLIAKSMSFGDSISRRHTAATFALTQERLVKIGTSMNSEFDSQLTFFNRGLIVFALWLLLYIVWWIIVDAPSPEKKTYLLMQRRRRKRDHL